MKAFLLAAGLGTRLRPLTETVPKCLIPIAGKPLLGWWIDLMERHGISEVLINLHHLPDKVEGFLSESKTSIRFRPFREKELLGSAGTLRKNREFVAGERDFFILYADNLTNYDLTTFLGFHRRYRHDLSMALFTASNPRACGIAEIDDQNTITRFDEKPEHPRTSLANAGIYVASPSILDLIPEKDTADIGFDLLPLLAGRMKGWVADGYLRDIGTLESLKLAEQEWPKVMGRVR